MSSDFLIYRTDHTQIEPVLADGLTFRIYRSPLEASGLVPSYAALNGPVATVKMLAKLATATRDYYAITRCGRILSDGWINKGFCKFYDIGEKDCVIGPIFSRLEERGHGLAHASLVRAINACLSEGMEWVYIDTTEENIASQKTILKSGMRRI